MTFLGAGATCVSGFATTGTFCADVLVFVPLSYYCLRVFLKSKFARVHYALSVLLN
jgi:hypothetical protein